MHARASRSSYRSHPGRPAPGLLAGLGAALVAFAAGAPDRAPGELVEVRRLPGHVDGVEDLALSPDGRRLATADQNVTLRLWSFPEGELERRTLTAASSLRFDPAGRRLALDPLEEDSEALRAHSRPYAVGADDHLRAR